MSSDGKQRWMVQERGDSVTLSACTNFQATQLGPLPNKQQLVVSCQTLNS